MVRVALLPSATFCVGGVIEPCASVLAVTVCRIASKPIVIVQSATIAPLA